MLDLDKNAALQELQEMYSSNDFQAGVDLLIKTRGNWSPDKFHELLGSFYLKLENFARARYHLELALEKGSLSSSVTHNLEYLMVEMGFSESGYTGWWDQFNNVVSLLPFEIWAALSLLLLSAAFWKFHRRWHGQGRKFILTMWICAALPQVLFWGVLQQRMSAIVLEEAPLYEGPSSVFNVAKTLRGGEKVVIGKDGNGWSLIVAPKFFRGWV